MGRESQRQITRRNTVPVVRDANQFPPAVLDLDRDPRRAGVERVFEQFLHHGRGAFDHFAGGDAIDQCGRELLNRSTKHGGEL